MEVVKAGETIQIKSMENLARRKCDYEATEENKAISEKMGVDVRVQGYFMKQSEKSPCLIFKCSQNEKVKNTGACKKKRSTPDGVEEVIVKDPGIAFMFSLTFLTYISWSLIKHLNLDV